MLSAGDIAVLLLGGFWAVLVLFLALVLVKLSRVLKATEDLVAGITERTVPLLGEVTTSVVHVNSELERVDAITANVQSITGNVAALTSLFGATLGSPLVKVAAFSYGVRRAASQRAKGDVEKRVKATMKAEKKAAKSARRAT